MEEVKVKGSFPRMEKPFLGKSFEGIVKLRRLTFKEKKLVEKSLKTIRLVQDEKDPKGKKMKKIIDIHDEDTEILAMHFAIMDAPWWTRNDNGIVTAGNTKEWIENLPGEVGDQIMDVLNKENTKDSDAEKNLNGQ